MVHASVTICEPEAVKVRLCSGLTVPSLRSHLYVTVPGPFIVITPVKVKAAGHVLLEAGETFAMMSEGATIVVGLAVGVGDDIPVGALVAVGVAGAGQLTA